jgi:hypothetical protein
MKCLDFDRKSRRMAESADYGQGKNWGASTHYLKVADPGKPSECGERVTVELEIPTRMNGCATS